MYDFLPYEALTEQQTLPDPFLKPDGSRICDRAQWPAQREYLKAMLAHYLYGAMPPDPGNVTGEVLSSQTDGKTIREQVRLTFGPERCLGMDIDIHRPVSDNRVPMMILNTFGGNDCPVEEELMERGIGLVRFDKEQLGPDWFNFRQQSPVIAAYPECSAGAIAVWAWGYSRIIDWLLTTDFCCPARIGATGYSRNGKVALCAGIYDERITLVAPGGSGAGGSGLFRIMGNRYGQGYGTQETIGSMSQMFYFWWSPQIRNFGIERDRPAPDFSRFAKNDYPSLLAQIDQSRRGQIGPEYRLPFDMHFARALIAPRALICTDSLNDEWANPYGIQVNWRAAAEVYRFLGAEDNHAMLLREGPHAFSYTDWMAISDFMAAKFLHNDPKRSLYLTLYVPKSTEEQKNTMSPQNFYHIPHCNWKAPEK